MTSHNSQSLNSNQESSLQDQNAEESSLVRSVIYKFISYAYRYPDESNHQCLKDLWEGVISATSESQSLSKMLDELEECFNSRSREQIEDEYIVLFGHSAQGNCPPFEIEYGESGEEIQKPHELSDIAAFYRAAGLQYSERAIDRVDFVATELEFMNFLYFKRAYAEEKREKPLIDSCNEMQRKFLQDHLARWIPAFTRRIMQYSNDGFYGVLAKLSLHFILKNCEELGVEPGSEMLRIRVPLQMSGDCKDCSSSMKES